MHQKVPDARVNAVDRSYMVLLGFNSQNKEILIFNLVSRYAEITDKLNYLQKVGVFQKDLICSRRNSNSIIVLCIVRHSNIIVIY